MLIAIAPAIANGRTFSNLSMTGRSTVSVKPLGAIGLIYCGTPAREA